MAEAMLLLACCFPGCFVIQNMFEVFIKKIKGFKVLIHILLNKSTIIEIVTDGIKPLNSQTCSCVVCIYSDVLVGITKNRVFVIFNLHYVLSGYNNVLSKYSCFTKERKTLLTDLFEAHEYY